MEIKLSKIIKITKEISVNLTHCRTVAKRIKATNKNGTYKCTNYLSFSGYHFLAFARWFSFEVTHMFK